VQALRVITLTPFAWLLPRPCAAAGVCGGFAVPLCTWYLWYQDCGHQYVLGVGLVPSEFQFQQVPPPQFRCAALCCTAVHTAGGLLQATAHQPQISRCPACACVPMHRMRIQVDYGTLLPFVIQQNCECIRNIRGTRCVCFCFCRCTGLHLPQHGRWAYLPSCATCCIRHTYAYAAQSIAWLISPCLTCFSHGVDTKLVLHECLAVHVSLIWPELIDRQTVEGLQTKQPSKTEQRAC